MATGARRYQESFSGVFPFSVLEGWSLNLTPEMCLSPVLLRFFDVEQLPCLSQTALPSELPCEIQFLPFAVLEGFSRRACQERDEEESMVGSL